MIYYRVTEDWITHLEGGLRGELLAALRGLDLARLQKYPPPKIGGLPFGNESRVFERFIRGESAQLDASALHKFYLSFASGEDLLLYRAFRQNSALPREDWAEIIGAENIDKWTENKFLRVDEADRFVCRFSVTAIDGVVLLVDPINDHGGPHETAALPSGYKPQDGDRDIEQFNHTYIGLDSLRQIDTMVSSAGWRVRRGERYLDCGPGAGALLLYFARKFEEAVGIDINPRAVTLSRFNAELNGMDNVTTANGDALNLQGKFGKFDLVSWNLPFMFFPEENKDEAIDAFGGELGIGLCLGFIDALPELIKEKGMACLAALSPIMRSGENVLEARLKERLGRLSLDCKLIVAQTSLAHTKELWDFHQSHDIRKFESVYLYLKHGSGELERVEAPVSRKMIDVVREKMYRRKFA